DQMPGQLREAWREAAAAVVQAALPGGPRQPGTWPVFAAALPPAAAAPPPPSGGGADSAGHLGARGRGSAPPGPWRGGVGERAQTLDPEEPATWPARSHLAYWTGMAGDAAGARDQYAALLPIFERVLGPGHPDTLGARDNLARWTGAAGDAAGARDQYAALLPIFQRGRGPGHPATPTTRRNLAPCTS